MFTLSSKTFIFDFKSLHPNIQPRTIMSTSDSSNELRPVKFQGYFSFAKKPTAPMLHMLNSVCKGNFESGRIKTLPNTPAIPTDAPLCHWIPRTIVVKGMSEKQHILSTDGNSIFPKFCDWLQILIDHIIVPHENALEGLVFYTYPELKGTAQRSEETGAISMVDNQKDILIDISYENAKKFHHDRLHTHRLQQQKLAQFCQALQPTTKESKEEEEPKKSKNKAGKTPPPKSIPISLGNDQDIASKSEPKKSKNIVVMDTDLWNPFQEDDDDDDDEDEEEEAPKKKAKPSTKKREKEEEKNEEDSPKSPNDVESRWSTDEKEILMSHAINYEKLPLTKLLPIVTKALPGKTKEDIESRLIKFRKLVDSENPGSDWAIVKEKPSNENVTLGKRKPEERNSTKSKEEEKPKPITKPKSKPTIIEDSDDDNNLVSRKETKKGDVKKAKKLHEESASIQVDLQKSISNVMNKYNLTDVTLGRIVFDKDNFGFHTKIYCRIPEDDQVEIGRKLWDHNASSFGFSKTDFGRRFKNSKGDNFTITGWTDRTKNTKEKGFAHILATDDSGDTIKFYDEDVKKYLKRMTKSSSKK